MNVNDEYITHMGFADDMAIIAETAEDLSTMLDDLSTFLIEWVIKKTWLLFALSRRPVNQLICDFLIDWFLVKIRSPATSR